VLGSSIDVPPMHKSIPTNTSHSGALIMVAMSKAKPPSPAAPSKRRLAAGDGPEPGGQSLPRPHYSRATPDAPSNLPKPGMSNAPSKVPAKRAGTDSHPDRPMITAGAGPSPGGASVASRHYHTNTPDLKAGKKGLFSHSMNKNGV
jgi:hypothetical protein